MINFMKLTPLEKAILIPPGPNNKFSQGVRKDSLTGFTHEPVRHNSWRTVQPSTRTKFGTGFVPYQKLRFGTGGFAPRRNPAREEATAATVGYPTWCPIKPWGFTLIEILVSITIFLVVVGMASTFFLNTLNYWKRGYSLTRRQQAARLVFSRMTENISSLFLSTSRGIYCFGSKDKFYFISASVKGDEGDLAEMGYEFNLADNALLFLYQERADFDFGTYDSKDMIAIKVLEVTFNYLDETGSWLEDWDSRIGGQQEGIAPQAIKISFGIENLDFPDNKEIFETVIELPIRTKY